MKIIQGGYSEPVLQPCYLVGIGTIFLLAPYLGWFLSTLIVTAPAFYIAVKIAKKQNERDDAIRKLVWDKLSLYLNIYDVSSLLRANKSGITPEILELGLRISKRDATKLCSELITANLATSAAKRKQDDRHFGETRNVAPRLTQVAKA